MASSGFIDRSILDQVASKLLEVEVKVDEADLAARVAMLEFKKHFPSVDTQGLELPTPLLINNPEKGPITKLVDIPAIEESALGVVLAEERVQVVRAKYSPEVQIQMGASSPMDPNESTSGQAGILVKYDFFDGGAKDAELLRSEESLAKAKITLEFVKENALQAIKTSRARVIHSRGALELAEKRLPIIDQQIKVAESQIQTGQVNVAKVFEAKIQRRDLTHQIRRERANLTISRFNLAAALGVLGNELDFINDRK
jgi:outer membrane protein TolC